MSKVLQWLAQRRPCRIIDGETGEAYLRRYFLFAVGPRHDPWLVAYLHHFLDSDPDRGLHNHPWPWAAALILAGGYYESVHVPKDPFKPVLRWRWPGRLVRFNHQHQHRVILPRQRQAWTLFLHGPWRKPWGFFRYWQEVDDEGCWLAGRIYHEQSAQSSVGWWRQGSAHG